MYVVTLIGICLFLRPDKVLPLCIEDFYPACFVRTRDGQIHALCLCMQGKKDNAWKYAFLACMQALDG
jgi:hypothetical protein